MKKYVSIILTLLIVTFSCKEKMESKKNNVVSAEDLKGTVQKLNQSLIEAAKDKDFSKIIDLYMDEAIVLAEYNPLIDGKKQIENYYTEVFKKQNIEAYQKETEELFDFGETVLEIGNFKKKFSDKKYYEGKYFNVWKYKNDGNLLLKAEAFGYYHPIDTPANLRVLSIEEESLGLMPRKGKKIPLELDAYDALNENCVRDRDTKKLIETYTEDATYYPFANTKKDGIENLKKHFIDYHKNPVKIDSIQVWTYDYEKVSDGIIQYSKFYVQWTVPGFTGNTQGTGLIFYKRREDNSLKIHRQIGLHIYNE
ncbi:MAG: hypothetical protein R3E32_12745 [Chitinophagales bacterium]